ncbi:uncharacterized protein BJX67DRAFT_349356 [Aspergillus lucknowensis]|uniref:Uncharacterized protein n=1 Tax=Aspergillus lucknowensis TaxID=176173 RepID=A0ABR4LWJ6_9EURO
MVELRKRKAAPAPAGTEPPAPARTKPAPEKKSRVTKKSDSTSSKSKSKPKSKAKSSTMPSNRASGDASTSQSRPLTTGDKIPLNLRLSVHRRLQTKETISMKDLLAECDRGGILLFAFGKALSDQTADFVGEMDHALLDNERLEVTTIGLSPDSMPNLAKLSTSLSSFDYLSDPGKKLLTPLGLGNISLTDKKGHVGVALISKSGELLIPVKSGKMERVLDDYWKETEILLENMDNEDEESDL